MILLLFLLGAILLVCGVAIAYVSGAIAMLGFVVTGLGDFIAILPQAVFSQLDVFALMAMPLFILAGELMNRNKITDALIEFSMLLVGRVRGGLGHVNVLTSLFFAGISGSAIADAAALSNTLVPAMRERGYKTDYAAAITAAAAIIGPIIPPSIVMIFYGAIMGVDAASLFAGGIGPGLLLAVMLMAANLFFAYRDDHPAGVRPAPGARRRVVRRALPALSVPVVIMAGIVLGWMTPTEAAAVAVIVSGLIGILYRTLSRAVWRESVERTVELTGTIFIAMAAAAGVNLLATLTQLPVELAARITALGLGLQGYMLLLTLVLLITGMFLDTQIALSLMVPILAPVATHLGADPVHVGVMICITLSMGLITPPLGGVTMVTATITGVPYWRLVRATLPFVLLELLLLLVVVLVPDVSLSIPRHLGMMP